MNGTTGLSGGFVFVGDSITAAGRDAGDPDDVGHGFVRMLADRLGASAATVRNRGVRGDRAVDVRARWRTDCLALEPAVITLLVGVNDTWRRFDSGQSNGIEAYAETLGSLLIETREQSSSVVLLVEPFVLTTGVVTPEWTIDIDARRAAVARVEQQYGAAVVSTQRDFDVAAGAHPERLLHDGVHPTEAGHRLLAHAWWGAWTYLQRSAV